MEQHVLKEDELVMVSDEQGDMPEGRRRLGLYYRDMRYLSIFEMTINGQRSRSALPSLRFTAPVPSSPKPQRPPP